ncbi:nuclear transport factor 2 family protein [Streptomyces roseirectus]|uniref:Nuclear transport factor 2 family protein n=1 Tax=Streptomyces roseirectus TaxID=2768066 RepID=A0A7H0IPI4_9ACTN|nr:nuclear transport factor 2 family protein [Streptomyces roseirectus]QNP74700.1 nuclear transport factor 2 family protein [Streptomyces roseirectus]
MTTTTPAGPAFADVLAAAGLTPDGTAPTATAPDMSREPSAQEAGSGVEHHKAVAVAVLKGLFEAGDTQVVDRHVRPDLVQHSPFVPDGAQALKNAGGAVHARFPDAEYRVQRVIAQGDLVLAHSHLVLTPGTRGTAVVDTFRFRGGRIAEHWQVAQEVPEATANGNDMFSTVSRPQTNEPGPAWLTPHHEKLVAEVFDQVLVRKNPAAADTYYTPEYHQHNPNIPDGRDAAKTWLGAYFDAFPQLSVSAPKLLVAEGDVVAVHSHGVPAPGLRGLAIVDLFRVVDGKVVEHWDVLQEVPETAANDNTMF